MKHPTIEQLEKYLNGKTGIFKSGHIERHIAKCAECATKVEELKEENQLAEELKKLFTAFPQEDKREEDQTYINISKIFGSPKHGTSA